LYNILIEFCTSLKLVKVNKLSLKETYTKARIGKNGMVHFLFRMAWNKEMLYRNCFSNLL